jgi:hypothetical protein
VNIDRAALLDELRSGDGWLADIRRLAATMRSATRNEPGLLVVGMPDDEPWHFVAHLEQESRRSGHPELSPVLIRHQVKSGASPHLAIDLSRLSATHPGEVVLVVAAEATSAELLSRVQDARRAGATILALEASGQPDLQDLAHEVVTIEDQAGRQSWPGARFEAAQHLLSVAAGHERHRPRRLSFKR